MALFGFDLVSLANLRHYLRFKRHLRQWKRSGGHITKKYPILSDFRGEAGVARGHYFHQDLLVATRIAQSSPRRHIDIGSRIDGFVAHVASFRQIELLDIRELNSSDYPNIIYKQADITNPRSIAGIQTDSLSCLSVLEHLGLGRYGDIINPKGHIVGFNSLLQLLEIGGTMYLSFPIGKRNEIHFNAHRVFHPLDILGWSEGIKSLQLAGFDFVDDKGHLHQNVDLLASQIDCTFGCGIYTFVKNA